MGTVKAAARQCSSTAVAEIAQAAEPKYHAAALGGVFWRRQPWRHERRGEIVASTGELRCGVCRFITLGAIDGTTLGDIGAKGEYQKDPVAAPSQKEKKWMHGLDLDPHAMPADSA